ncbi:MAG: hypothetical protein K6G47_08150 [Clostridia bacterium]|nr:hypothetical protein [Clostridia bacterium]
MKKGFRTVAAVIVAAVMLTSCFSSRKTDEKETDATKKTVKATTEATDETSEVTDETTETTEETTAETTKEFEPIDESLPFDEKLEALDGVVRVDEVSTDTYVVWFNQPIDWNDPSVGYFRQRVQVCNVESDITNLNVSGYLLDDNFLAFGMQSYWQYTYMTNCVNAEFRFFGQSTPKGLDVNDPELWQYLTSYNAACDFHHITEQLKRVFPGKWLMSGGSKGGMTTMIQSMYFPSDMDLYIATVAPFSDGPQAADYYDNIYETIGNECYGEEKAAIYRETVLEFQVECIKHRDEMQDAFYQAGLDDGAVYTDFTTPEILFDLGVLEFATYTWQYSRDFDNIRSVLDSKDSPDYVSNLLQLLLSRSIPLDWSTTTPYYPYYIQAAMELGEHEYDFSFLRAALEKDGSGAELVITEDMEDMLLYRVVFPEQIYNSITYDPSVRQSVMEWMNTTECNVILLYGGCDVWYATRLPDVEDRDNFHTFVDQKSTHDEIAMMMEKSEQAKVFAIIDEVLGL